MGRQTPCTPRRSSDTTSSATRSAAIQYIWLIEFATSVAVSFGAALEVAQDRTFGLATCKYNVRKAKLGTVGAIQPLNAWNSASDNRSSPAPLESAVRPAAR